MVFSSIIFMFTFLPIILVTYYLSPRKLKNFILLLGSLVFYAWGEPIYIILMILTIVINYVLALLIKNQKGRRKKCIFILTLVLNVGMLGFFKYYDFIVGNINSIFSLNIQYNNLSLPIGISFYTFQTISYIVDVYLNKVKVQKNIISFATYISMFLQLVAGPIVKYTDINRELKSRKVNLDAIQEGIRLFILGLSSKVIIANNIGSLWNEVETMGFNNISTILAWMGIIAFSLQIYFDFNGYSLMAIGLGKILGFNFPNNFNYPYESRSITEFWRRWHITLGQWFKQYVYIPLGGNRLGRARTYFNLFIVWFLTGFWHGASYNFILWGLYFFILICMEKNGLLNLLNKHKLISHIYTIFFILVGWVLFAVIDLNQIINFFKKMFIFNAGNEWIYYLRNYIITYTIAIIFSTSFLKKIYNKFVKNNIVDTIILITIFLLSIAYLVDSSYNPFLYFRF